MEWDQGLLRKLSAFKSRIHLSQKMVQKWIANRSHIEIFSCRSKMVVTQYLSLAVPWQQAFLSVAWCHLDSFLKPHRKCVFCILSKFCYTRFHFYDLAWALQTSLDLDCNLIVNGLTHCKPFLAVTKETRKHPEWSTLRNPVARDTVSASHTSHPSSTIWSRHVQIIMYL